MHKSKNLAFGADVIQFDNEIGMTIHQRYLVNNPLVKLISGDKIHYGPI